MTTLIHPSHPTVRLGGLIAASLAIHWLALTGWEERATTPVAATTLTLELLTNPVTEPQHAARVEGSKPQLTQPQPRPLVQPTPSKPAATPTSTTPETATATTSQPVQSVAITAGSTPEPQAPTWVDEGKRHTKPFVLAEAQTRIRDTLNQDLNQHFKYPRLARLRSWEGTVLLDLQIETDGRISHITLAQSSGYSLLDNNAIDTLNRIGTISGAQQWLEGENIELQIPIIYRLSDS